MTEESTELAVKSTQDGGYMGDLALVASIKQRIVTMAQVPPDVPVEVVRQMAQLAAMYKLNPFTGDLYIIEVGSVKNDATNQYEKKYSVHVGIKGLRKAARRKANYQCSFRVMSEDEVKHSRPREYAPEDIGVECTLWRLDVATECRLAGIPYMPTKAVGYWRKNAQQRFIKGGGREWKPDNIPNTWTAEMVAEKRAEVNAIKKAFDIDVSVDDPGYGVDADDDFTGNVAVVQRQLESIERDEAPVQRPTPRYEADGDILFENGAVAHETPGTWKQVEPEEDFGLLGSTPEPEPPPAPESTQAGSTPGLCPHCHAPAGKPHAKNCPTLKAGSTQQEEPEPAPPPTMTADGVDLADYIYLFHNPDFKFAPETVKLIREFRELKNGATMNPKQHGFIVALIDKAYGTEEFKPHRYILSALAGRLVDHEHPLALAQQVILNWFKFPEINAEQIAGMNGLAASVIALYQQQEDL